MALFDTFPGNVFLAPMAGITDQPTRQIVYEQSEGN